MAIQCAPVSEETSRTRSPRHDGLPRRSLRSLLAMTKNVYGHHNPHSIPSPICHRERVSPWRSTVNQLAKRQVVRVPRDTMDCRVGHFRSLLAMTKSVYSHHNPHSIPSPICHREGIVRGDPQFLAKTTSLSNSPHHNSFDNSPKYLV